MSLDSIDRKPLKANMQTSKPKPKGRKKVSNLLKYLGTSVPVKPSQNEFISKPSNSSNKRIFENQWFQCRHCNKTIYAKMNLTRHEPMCEILGKYRDGRKCLICGSVFTKDHFRRKHFELFDSIGRARLDKQGKTECQYCRLQFKRTDYLSSHEKSCQELHQIIKGTTCIICNHEYKTRQTAIGHAKWHHKEKFYDHLGQPSDNQVKESQTVSNPTVIKFSKSGQSAQESSENEIIDLSNEEVPEQSTVQRVQQILGFKEEIDHFEESVQNDEIDVISDNTDPDENIFEDIEDCVDENETETELDKMPRAKLVAKPEPTIEDFMVEGVDPTSVTKLLVCPICQAKFVLTEQMGDHITKFHKMPMEVFVQMELKVKKLFV